MTTLRIFCVLLAVMAMLCVSQTTQAATVEVVTTATGSGADTMMDSGSGEPDGGAAFYGAWEKTYVYQNAGIDGQFPMFKFDLSGVSGNFESLSGASLKLFIGQDDVFAGDTHNMKLLGINNGSDNENFDEATMRYSQLHANFQGGFDESLTYETNKVTYIDTLTREAVTAGHVLGNSWAWPDHSNSPAAAETNLINFLKSTAVNGVASFFVGTADATTPPYTIFATKEWDPDHSGHDPLNTYDGALYDIGDLAPSLTLTFGGSGDLNDSGNVDSVDLDIIIGAWNTFVTPGAKSLGDPSGDGWVSGLDLDIVMRDWNPAPAAAGASVPEPGSLALLALGSLVLLVLRRRCRV